MEQDESLPLPQVIEESDSYRQGYKECLQDILAIIRKEGKDRLVGWAEGILTAMK